MREVKQQSMPLTVEEYIQFELGSERRHEYINGQLIEMPVEKAVNNRTAGRVYVFLLSSLTPKGFQVYNHDVKVASHDRTKYFYPEGKMVFYPDLGCSPGISRLVKEQNTARLPSFWAKRYFI